MRGKLHRLIVRRATDADHPSWAQMLSQLHPEQSAADFERELTELVALPQPYVGFIAVADEGNAIGFIDARVRNYAEGAPNESVAYVEDLWVAPERRRQGIARQLLAHVERWARDEGLGWIGSDARLDNLESHRWHRAAGFDEVERLVVFGKPLS